MRIEPMQFRPENLRSHDLIQIAFSDEDDGYENEARQSALDELRRRKINFAEVRSIGNDINEAYHEDVLRATAPLQTWIVVVVILTAITWVIPSLISDRMSSRGYYQKVEDGRVAFRIGLVLWFGVIATLVYFLG